MLGAHLADDDALRRWRADEYLFPPIHYLWKHGLVKQGHWRYPTADEREAVLGFLPGHTHSALTTAAGHVEREDTRLKLLGDSLQTGVASYLLAWLFQQC